jgi:uncharacterized protein with HEPN domain
MNRSDLDRLRDARDFTRYALGNAGGLSAEVLADALQPQHAALYDLVVIGEALGGVAAEVRAAAPHVDWKAIRDLRNIIVHADRQVDLETIAGIIENRIDPLISDLNNLIAPLERSDP